MSRKEREGKGGEKEERVRLKKQREKRKEERGRDRGRKGGKEKIEEKRGGTEGEDG